jgi:hypothetical protein
MYGSSRQYAEQYRKMSVSTSITDADPHKLVSLLFAGACQRIRQAQACLAQAGVPGVVVRVADGRIRDAMTVACVLRAHHMAVTGQLPAALAVAMLRQGE